MFIGSTYYCILSENWLLGVKFLIYSEIPIYELLCENYAGKCVRNDGSHIILAYLLSRLD